MIPLFWGLLLLEATYGAYLSVWPLWIERLGAPIAIVGLVLGVGGFLRLFVIGPSAAIADRFGYRRTIIVARTITITGLIVAAFATHWTQLLIVVAAISIGELVFPLVQSIVASEAGDQRMRSFALVFNVGPSIALAAAPLIGALLVGFFGMRSAFLLGAVFSLLSLTQLAKISEPETDSSNAATTATSYLAATRLQSVRLIGGLLLITVFSLSLGVAFIPTFLKDVRGFEPAGITALGSLPAIGSAMLGLAVARLMWLQRRPFIACAISVGLMAIVLLVIRESSFLPLLMVAFVLRGGLFSTWAMLISALGEYAPASLRSRAFAILEMIGGLAFSLGPIIAGLLYSQRKTLPFEVAIILALMLVPAYILAQRRANRMPKTDDGRRTTSNAVAPAESDQPRVDSSTIAEVNL